MLPSQTAYPAGFETLTPDWPQFPCWCHKCDASVWITGIYLVTVLLSCYVIWKSYSNFNINYLLTPVTPNDPRFTYDPITKVEDLKLMYMYESYGHAM